MNFNTLDRYLDTFYAEKNIPGVGISVYQYGEHLHTYTAGYADVEKKVPFRADTIFNLYSATKLSTCTAAVRLIEKGRLHLDDPVEKYLPEIAECTVCQEDGTIAQAKNKMTIRHLLSMTAGFSYDSDTAELKDLLEKTEGHPTTRQVAGTLAQTPLLFEPGTHFKYSFCHDVLGAVLEVACGESLENILQKEIFEPIGMVDTTFHLKEEKRFRLAPEYHHFNGKTGCAEKVVYKAGVDMGMGPLYESGGGGLLSTVNDYALLTAMLANGGVSANGQRILKQESIDMMRTHQLTGAALREFEQFAGWNKAGYGYGLGVRVLLDRERNNSLSENGEFGWDGALGCLVLSDPKSGISFFYAQHESGSPWFTWHGMVRNYVYACVIGSGGE